MVADDPCFHHFFQVTEVQYTQVEEEEVVVKHPIHCYLDLWVLEVMELLALPLLPPCVVLEVVEGVLQVDPGEGVEVLEDHGCPQYLVVQDASAVDVAVPE